MTAPTRPPGDVVAPLPEGWTCDPADPGCVTGPGWKSREIDAEGPEVSITSHEDDWNPTVPIWCAIRALHDGAPDDMQAYCDRREAAAWTSFYDGNFKTWVPQRLHGYELMVLARGVAHVVMTADGSSFSRRGRDGERVAVHGVTHWRPMVALPEGA
jgi:hypothetical protein